jgi:hypothetical protein
MLLPEPYEYVDLHHGESMMIRVTGYEQGMAIIHPTTITPRHIRIHMDQHQLTEPPPAGTPIHNEIPVLRLTGERLDKPSPAHYFDISSKTLGADLMARFRGNVLLPVTITLTANGQRPSKRYSVEVS